MTAPDDAVLAYWSEHREQLRQSESQRAVLTNYVLAIAAAISGLVVQQHFRLQTLPLSVLVVLIGLYGALAAAKYHERANYHLGQARALTQALVQSGDLADNDVILDQVPPRPLPASIRGCPGSGCTGCGPVFTSVSRRTAWS